MRYIAMSSPKAHEAVGPFADEQDATEWARTQPDGECRYTLIRLVEPSVPLLPYRDIGYTAEECEREMRRMTNGTRGCTNPDEHLGTASPHAYGKVN